MFREDRQQVGAALGDVVRQQLNPIDAHQPEQAIVTPLERAPPIAGIHRGQLPAQHDYEEVARSASRLQEARVDALGFALDEVEHVLHQPSGREDFAVVSDALL